MLCRRCAGSTYMLIKCSVHTIIIQKCIYMALHMFLFLQSESYTCQIGMDDIEISLHRLLPD